MAAVAASVATGAWLLVPPVVGAQPLPAECVQPTAGGDVTCIYGFTGAQQQFHVPAGVTSLRVTATAPYNGRDFAIANGRGAVVSGTVQVTGNRALYVLVGGPGGFATPGEPGPGGFNGGGTGSPGTVGRPISGGQGGAGASDVRTVPTSDPATLQSRLLVAGGGGGRARNCCPGSGAGLGGDAGGNGYGANAGGAGTTTGGGTATGTATPGTLGFGGNAGSGVGENAGGGGAGLYGGGGGATVSGGGGGGGSSLVPAGGTLALAEAGTAATVVITYTPAPAPPCTGSACGFPGSSGR